MIQYKPIKKQHLAGIIKLCKAEGWPSYTESKETTWRILTAPGVCTVVASAGKNVVGFIQLQSDGNVQAHLSLIVVDKNRRKKGIATRLMQHAFVRSGAQRIDLITESPEFYRSFAHHEWYGFRLHPQYDKKLFNQVLRRSRR